MNDTHIIVCEVRDYEMRVGTKVQAKLAKRQTSFIVDCDLLQIIVQIICMELMGGELSADSC
jgi:hypothetical protein